MDERPGHYDDPTLLESLSFAFATLGIGSAPLGILWGGLELFRCQGPKPSVVLSAACMIIATFVALVIFSRKRRARCGRRPVALIVLLILETFAAGLFALPALGRGRVGAGGPEARGYLEGVIEWKREALASGEKVPNLLELVVHDSEPTELFTDFCSCMPLSDVRYGSVSLHDYYQGRVDRETLLKAADAEWAKTPGWERVGGYVVCNDRATLETREPPVIVGYTLPRYRADYAPMLVILSNQLTLVTDNEADRAEIESALREARSRGLVVPPDDIFAHAKWLSEQ